MDNLTHSLVGLMMSRCGLDSIGANRGAKGTAAMLVLAANVPDLDAYPFFTSALDYLDIHRGYTHGLAFAPLMALLPMAIVKFVTKTRPSLAAWFACTLVVLSHLLLDWTNVYGVRLLLPFSDRWLRLDITNVVDPIIWLILVLAMAIPSFFQLISSTIGEKKSDGPKRAWAWVALLLLCGYEGMRWNSHDKAVRAMNSLLYMDEVPQAVYAFPQTFGFMEWRGIVEGEKFVYEIPVGRNGDFLMRDATVDYKIGHAPTVDAAKETHTFQVVQRFNQVPFWRINPMVDVTEVVLMDLRFTSITSNVGGFTAKAMVEPDGRIRDTSFGFGR